jgi:hypothetical protein
MKITEFLKEDGSNPTDTITIDIPLFIRLMEYAREDAQTDMDLHTVAERITIIGSEGATLGMEDYADICPTKESMNEEFDSAEYNDEAGMAKTNLVTTIRMSLELANHIDDNDNLPEWCQEKLAVAKGMIVAVGDYIISQKVQGIDPKLAECATSGGTSSGGIATSMGGGDGFGNSIFMGRKGPVKTKKSKR